MKRSYVFFLFLMTGGIVFSPALTSFFYWDDFPLLSTARYIGNPISFFTQNYFPGGHNYRPLGMFSYWLFYKLFGLNPVLHNLLNFLLHAVNAFLFYLLLQHLLDRRPFIVLCSSFLFLVHPVSISTSLWQADRFDLMATMFILLAIYFFIRYASTHRRRYHAFSVFCTLLAMLSKEIAYILPLLITLILFTFPGLKIRDQWLRRIFVLLPYYLTGFFLYVMRFFLLQVTDSYFFQAGIITSVWNGFSKWLRFMPDLYLSHFSSSVIGDVARIFFLLWAFLVIVVIFSSIRRRKVIPWELFLFSLGIIGMAGLIMAPVIGLSTFVGTEVFSFFLIAEGRFYYFASIGFFTFVGASLSLLFEFIGTRRNYQAYSVWILSPFLLGAFFYSISSFLLSQKWRALTNGEERQLIEQAVHMVQQSTSAGFGSKIYFLNTQGHSHFREFGDGILKCMAPEKSNFIHFLFFTEKPPWYNFVLREDIHKIRMEPLLDRTVEKGFSPSVAGDLAYFYLNFPKGEEIVRDEKAIFFEFLKEEKRFVDVTHAIKSGLREVQFFPLESSRPRRPG